MNILDALKEAKLTQSSIIRTPYPSLRYSTKEYAQYTVDDILADDWEVEEKIQVCRHHLSAVLNAAIGIDGEEVAVDIAQAWKLLKGFASGKGLEDESY